MTSEPGIIEQTKEALTDTEHSLGEKAPGSPFAVVALSYLVVLAAACGVVALVMWLAR